MRRPIISARESLFWLALAAAGGVLVLVVMRPGHTPTEPPLIALREGGQAGTAQRSAAPPVGVRRHVWPQPDVLEVEAPLPSGATLPLTVAEVDPQSGYEMPFAPDATTAGNAAAIPSDAAGLCAALRDALTNGRETDLATIRARLVALGTNAVPSLSALLRSGTDRVEVEAVRLLVQIGDSEGLAAALGKVLTVPRESPAYGLFLTAFADNRSPAVAQWLTATLGKTQYAETRQQMLDILYAMRGPEIVEALDRAALNPMDDMHAKDSRENLAMRHDPSETEGLADLLESGDESIREAAAYGLAYIGSSDACQILADYAEAFPFCANALASISSTYAQEALLALASSSTRSVVVRTSAVQSLASQPSQRVKTVLANAVIQEPNTIVVDAMQAALNTMASDGAEHSEITPSDKGYEGELWF